MNKISLMLVLVSGLALSACATGIRPTAGMGQRCHRRCDAAKGQFQGARLLAQG
jgi:hypothetical protein